MTLKSKIKYLLRKYPLIIRYFKKINRGIILPINKTKRNFLLRKFNHGGFKKFNVSEYNFFLFLNPKNGMMDETAFLEKTYEKEVTSILLKNLKTDSVFIDVGANIGYYTNLAGSICKNGKVLAFEPIKRIYEQNLKSIKRNKYKNVELLNFALGEKTEKSKINIFNKNVGASSIISGKNQTVDSVEKIKITYLDKLFKKIKRIDLIKIDAEGFEYFVFLGMKKLLKKFKPKIVFEFSPYAYEMINKDLSKKILIFLKKLGYSLYDLDYGINIINFEDYLKLFNESEAHTNIFCVQSFKG